MWHSVHSRDKTNFVLKNQKTLLKNPKTMEKSKLLGVGEDLLVSGTRNPDFLDSGSRFPEFLMKMAWGRGISRNSPHVNNMSHVTCGTKFFEKLIQFRVNVVSILSQIVCRCVYVWVCVCVMTAANSNVNVNYSE